MVAKKQSLYDIFYENPKRKLGKDPTTSTGLVGKVYAVLTEGEATAEQIAKRLDLHPYYIWPRLGELIRAKAIEKTDKWAINESSGKKAKLYRIKPRLHVIEGAGMLEDDSA